MLATIRESSRAFAEDEACASILRQAMFDSLAFLKPETKARLTGLTSLGQKNRRRKLAIVEDSVVGFSDWHNNEIDYLFISPPFRRNKIGSKLVDAVQEVVAGDVSLLSFKKNRGALSFYLRIGFLIAGEREGVFFSERQDNFVLNRPFDSIRSD